MAVLNWIGGEHEFALPLGELRALQNACDAGPEEILGRISAGNWRVEDLYETVRLGLIGGGMAREDANKLVRKVWDTHGPLHLKVIAQAIIHIAFVGDKGDDVGKDEAAESPKSSNSA